MSHGVSTDNLRISNRAHVILPYHFKLDEVEEDVKAPIKLEQRKKESALLIWIKLLVSESAWQIFWTVKYFEEKLDSKSCGKKPYV